MHCPYLEQILRKRTAFFKVFQADCHVDRKVHRFHGFVKSPSPSEDLRLRRLID